MCNVYVLYHHIFCSIVIIVYLLAAVDASILINYYHRLPWNKVKDTKIFSNNF